MLLQKTGWRIKQLISNRKSNHNYENAVDGNKSEEKELKVGTTRVEVTQRLSWSSQNPTVTEFPLLRRTTSNATTGTPHISPPSRTANSSASSLCSCDCDVALNRNGHFLLPCTLKRQVLCASSKLPEKTSQNVRSRRLIFSDQRSLTKLDTEFCSPVVNSMINSAPTFDLLGALSIDPAYEGNTPTGGLKHTKEEKQGNLSPDVEQLIRDTDEAFRALGAALTGAKSPSEGWCNTDSRIVATHSESLRIPKKPSPRSEQVPASAMGILAESKLKTTKPSRNKPSLLRAFKKVPPPPVNTPTRWTLNGVTHNVVDVFSGKKFRMEVDEMLTPDRMQEMTEMIKFKRERRTSAESTSSLDTEESTPTEPFHLEGLSDRIAAAQRATPFPPSPARTPPGIPKSPQSNIEQLAPIKGSEMVFDNISFPVPPRTPRRLSASRAASTLPTISEFSPLTIENRKPRNAICYGRQVLQPYILLPSTQFTLVAPSFRQGPIRVELAIQDRTEFSPVEESLDWTAFQMAISGMNDALTDCGWEEDEAMGDDIMIWWSSFGFSGYGRMDKEDPTISKPQIKVASSRRLKELTGDKTATTRGQALSIETGFGHMREEIATSKIVERLGTSSSEKRTSVSESLPPSPMLELILPLRSRDMEVIPMGFNLGHDLEDFLSWETRNVEKLV